MTDTLDLGTTTTPAATAAPTINSKALSDALDRHYTGGVGHRDQDSHATFRELTAPDGVHRADFVAISVWGSRGLAIDVHEIKVSRADWLNELRQPSKAEAWWPHSSRFWLVVPDASIVRDGELPEGWGLMVPPKQANRRAMKVVVPAAVRQPTVPLELLARVLLRGQADEKKRIEEAARQARLDGYDAAQEVIERENEPITEEQRDRLATLDALERIVGGRISTWGGRYTSRQIGEAIRWLEANKQLPDKYDLQRVDRLAGKLQETTKQLDALLDEIGVERRAS